MSETHYWPGPNDLGVYNLHHDSGAIWTEARWTGKHWLTKGGEEIDSLQAVAWGYLGVRREPAKAEPAYYWPDEPGDYTLCGHGGCKADARWDGRAFMFSDGEAASVSTLKKLGWFGVAREPAALTPTPKSITPDPDDGNAMVAQEALNELRMCRKSYQFERWSIKWGKPLTEMLGAR